METIHIFDEYKKEYKSEQTLHNKRTQIEPLIYDILKHKYFNVFEQFWRKNSIPTHSNKSIILIEDKLNILNPTSQIIACKLIIDTNTKNSEIIPCNNSTIEGSYTNDYNKKQ